MDPISRAMQKVGDDAEEFWRANPYALLPLVASEDQREEVVQALRLYEARPENRCPFVVFGAPFEVASAYFFALADQIAEDFERVRAGAAEEGVELPAFTSTDDGTVPSGTLKRAVLAMHKASHLLGQRFDGIVIALVPHHIVDQAGWREAVRLLARTRWSRCVRVAVFAPLGGPLGDVLDDSGVLFDLAPNDVVAFLKNLSRVVNAGLVPAPGAAPASPLPSTATGPGERVATWEMGEKLRVLLLSAAEAMGSGRPVDAVAVYRAARALCRAEGLREHEAALLLALGGACLVGQVPDLGADAYREAGVFAELAIESYSKAAGLAEGEGQWQMTSQAWLGVGGAHLLHGSSASAARAYIAAAEAARKGGIATLRREALRMAATCFAHCGQDEEAARVLRETRHVQAGAIASSASLREGGG
jgi:hypothetical protein